MEKRKPTNAKPDSIYDDCFTPKWDAIEDIDMEWASEYEDEEDWDDLEDL